MNDKPIDLPNAQTTPEHANVIDNKDNNIPENIPVMPQKDAPEKIKEGCGCQICVAVVLLFILAGMILPALSKPTGLPPSTTIGGVKYYLDKRNKTASVAGYHGRSSEITIPATITPYFINEPPYLINIEKYTVTGIRGIAFENCKNLTTIEIPAGVTSIVDSAFGYCDKLEKVIFLGDRPGVVRYGFVSADGMLFADGMPNLSCIYFIEGKKGWEDGGKWCGKTTKILPDVFYTENGIEYNLDNSDNTAKVAGHTTDLPAKVIIPATVTYNEKEYTVTGIRGIAFENCKNLTTIEIPAGVTEIGREAFAGCKSLTSIEIPAGVTSIGDGAFSACQSLTTVTFAEGSQLKAIGKFAFSGCNSLTSIEIPAGVTNIGDEAFRGCNSLTSVIFAKGGQLKEIGDRIFGGCNSLTSIEIPAGVTSIGWGAFEWCQSLASFTFAEGSQLKAIGEIAFIGCASLTSIEIPASVTNIGRRAFSGCNSLKKVVFLGDQPEVAINDSVFDRTPNLSCIYFIEGKKGWRDGGIWCGKTTKALKDK